MYKIDNNREAKSKVRPDEDRSEEIKHAERNDLRINTIYIVTTLLMNC